MNETLWLVLWLSVKYFVADFPLQAFPYIYRNKSKYGHPGGLVHALIHGVGTAVVFAAMGFDVATSLSLAGVDMVIHYHVDLVKMRLNNKMGWGPTTHDQFWTLLGLDQLLHGLTYIGLIAMVTK